MLNISKSNIGWSLFGVGFISIVCIIAGLSITLPLTIIAILIILALYEFYK